MKKRAFESDPDDASVSLPAAPPRTEPAPHARTAIGIIVLSWIVPLWMIRAILAYTTTEESTQLLHRILSLSSLALLLVGLGLAVRALDLARKDLRMRRRLAVAGLLLGLLTPVVWTSELVLAWEVYVAREHRDAVDAEADASTDASSSPAE